MPNPLTKFALAALATPMALAALAVPAAAQDDRPRAEVRYGDLDLASTEGRARLQRRVDGAIARMCGMRTANRLNLREHMAASQCREDARRDADARLASLLNRYGARLAAQDGVYRGAP